MTKGLHKDSLRKGEPNKWIVEDIIEKIRAEIERLKGICTAQIKANPGQTFPFVMEMTGYDKLLSFLSTFESEKPMNLEDDLEEEIKRYGEKNMFNIPAFQQVARHFAEWGAEHSGSSEIQNFLNELADYARRQVEELLPVIKKYNDYSEEQIEELRTHLMAMFLEGAGWQKEQMLKEAVPFYEILEAVPPGPGRETVRIIIVKED